MLLIRCGDGGGQRGVVFVIFVGKRWGRRDGDRGTESTEDKVSEEAEEKAGCHSQAALESFTKGL